MAVQPQTPYKEYTANGSTKSFALEFDCDNQDHLIVLVDDVEPVELEGGAEHVDAAFVGEQLSHRAEDPRRIPRGIVGEQHVARGRARLDPGHDVARRLRR